jgi:hypothetical protein
MLNVLSFKKVFLFIFFIVSSFKNINCQVQIGQDIDGKLQDEKFGSSVSLSKDGLSIASFSSNEKSNVRVYKYQNNIWAQQGKDIGIKGDNNLNKSISINDDGTIIAIGSPNINNKGQVKVYKMIDSNWIQLGEDINGLLDFDNFGHSVSLNASGLTLAVGSINSPNSSLKGVVKVFSFINNIWVQQGQDIVGNSNDDWSGWSVSLSSSGLILAIGSIGNDENANNAGQTKVFSLTNGIWSQLGNNINGKSSNDQFGCSVSLSSDGLTIAIAASGNDDNGDEAGHVKIYKFINNSWEQLGKDIKGNEAKDWLGWSVSLSSDGSTVAVGAPSYMKKNPANGYARVFKFINNSWEKFGVDMKGEFEDDWFGFSVSLSADGSILAVGGHFNDGNGSDSGHVRVFKLNIKNDK